MKSEGATPLFDAEKAWLGVDFDPTTCSSEGFPLTMSFTLTLEDVERLGGTKVRSDPHIHTYIM